MDAPDAHADILPARLRHAMAGRTRLALESPLPGRDRLVALADAISAMPGVGSVDVRVLTGSVIIQHEGAFETLIPLLAEKAGLVVLPAAPVLPFDPVMETMQRLSDAESLLRRASRERTDMRQMLFIGLVAAGLVQIARGRIAGPALTLFGQAATLAASWPARPKAPPPSKARSASPKR